MKPTGHTANTASTSKTGLLAALRGLLRAQGTGAPEATRGSGVSSRRLALSLLATTLGVLAFTAAPAFAETHRGFTASLGSEGTEAGKLKEPAGVAVNDKTGDVYVVDRGNNRVDEFEADGTFVRAWGWGVVEGPGKKEELQTCTIFTGCQQGAAGIGAGQLDAPEAIAVDNSASASDPSKEDVYVTNTAENVIEKFSATGEFKGEISKGSGGGSFSPLDGVAVDPSGLLWVYQSSGEIDDYSDAGSNAFLADCADPYAGKSPGFAVDAEDNIYLNRAFRRVGKLTSACATISPALEQINPSENATAVAVDSDASSAEFGDLYIDAGGAVEVFDAATGAPVEAFGGARHSVSGLGVAVDPVTGTVFVADTATSDVEVATFGATPEAPKAELASGETTSEATLHGVLNPGGATGRLEYQFDYDLGASCTGGQSVPVPAGVLADAKQAAVEAKVTGLQPNAQYTYCLVVVNAFGEAQGNEVSFKTEPVPPEVVVGTESASGVTASEATLNAQVNPNNESTTYAFEYSTKGKTGAGEKLEGTIVKVPGAPPAAALEGYGSRGASAPTGKVLSPGTTYFYRVVAENAQSKKETKPVVGLVEEFTTAAVPHTEVPNPISSSTATFKGTLTPLNKNVETEYFFYYNVGYEPLCTNARATAGAKAGVGSGVADVSTAVTGLQPDQKYTVCLVSFNASGALEEDSASPPIHFTTEPAPPAIEGESVALPVKAGEAHLEATVNPNNQTTVCTFQYGTEPSLATGTKTLLCEPGALAASFGGQGVGLTVTGLEAHSTYYYRVLATNAAGEEKGAIEHFETAIVPEVPGKEEGEPTGPTTATLKGVLNPTKAGEAGTYEFAYQQSSSGCQYTFYAEEEKRLEAEIKAALSNGSVLEQEKAHEKEAELQNDKTKEAEKNKNTTLGSASGVQGQAVDAEVTGLLPGAQYTFCLIAHNSVGETAIGSPVTFTTLPAAPAISSESVTNVQETAVTLHARIDPDGASTKYHFQYGTTNTYGASTPETELPTAGAAEATIPGLQPGTTYHYRVVATNSQSLAGGTPGHDQTFTTPAQPGATAETCPNAQARSEQPYGQALPDCRAYELVSPLEKSGFDVQAVDSRASVSDEPSGPEASAVAYISAGSFSEPKGTGLASRYISRRGTAGWSTQNVSPPGISREGGGENLGDGAFGELLFTPDLSKGILYDEDVPLVAGEQVGYDNLYVADLDSSPVSYQTVTTDNPETPQYSQDIGELPVPAGASTDLSHVVFYYRGVVYEWVGGRLYVVAGGSVGAPGFAHALKNGNPWHAVSADGLRVFFTPGGEGGPYGELGQLYVRENPEQEQSPEAAGKCTVPADACTIEVSASQRTEADPDGPQPAYFRDANAEGTRVFFTSRAELTNDANTGNPRVCKGSGEFPTGDCRANLYEYDLETKELTDLTAENPEGADVLGLVNAGQNAGEENSYVYFVANGVLASNENANEETAQPGNCKEGEQTLTGEHTCSLYVAHYSGGRWDTKFIATLAGGDENFYPAAGDETDWVGHEGGQALSDFGPGVHTVRVTPDGTTLAFESERSLTGYDNEPLQPGAGSAGNACTNNGGSSGAPVPCREVYLYDALTGKLVCASCDPSGARPVGPAELGGVETEGNGGSGQTVHWPFSLPRNLSEDGGRLFFQSPDALVPHDIDSKPDVYEWEQPASPTEAAKGENSCSPSSSTFSASSGGCVFPISDVAGNFESRFMDASASGNNVFIATNDQLVPEADADTRQNVYDVRVGGGFPVLAGPPPCNNGDSCKPPVSPQPGVFAPPASATFSGPGNPASPPPPPVAVVKPKTKTVKCTKGDVKNKNGRCVKSKKRKKSKATKSSDGKGRK